MLLMGMCVCKRRDSLFTTTAILDAIFNFQVKTNTIISKYCLKLFFVHSETFPVKYYDNISGFTHFIMCVRTAKLPENMILGVILNFMR